MLTHLVHRVVSSPGVYDAVQRWAGRDRVYQWLEPYLAESSGKVLLDLGGGTGELARVLPPTATYIWLDNDGRKLEGMRRKIKGARALLGDASRVGLKEKSIDIAACIAVAHHLTDEQFDKALQELARVCRVRLLLLDPVRHRSPVSRLLWKYDRGSYPRSADELRSHVERYFVICSEFHGSIYHHYWLCAATPRA